MWFFWAFFKGTYIPKCHKNHYVLPGFWPKWLLYARSPSCTEGWPQRGRRSVWGDLGNPLLLQLQHCKRLVFSYVYGAQVGVSPREFEDLHLVNIWKTSRFSYPKLYKGEAMRSTAKAQGSIVFLQCLGDTCAGYAGQAMYFSNVANISRPGQALYSSNVWVAPLLDMLARLYILQLCLVYLGLALALYSSNVFVTPVLDMLARPCISPMWLVYLGLARLCIPQMSGWHLCWICWPGCTFFHCG